MSSRILIFSILAVSIYSTLTSLKFLMQIQNTNPHQSSFADYQILTKDALKTYRFPQILPIYLQKVALRVEESLHYSFDYPESIDEWNQNQYLFPGQGSIRLGKEKRIFVLPIFHQLHCIESLYTAVLGKSKYPATLTNSHTNHCANYLRQWALCHADLTLEPGDFTSRNFTMDREGAVHQCLDWNTVFDTVKLNWYDWLEYRKLYNISDVLQKMEYSYTAL